MGDFGLMNKFETLKDIMRHGENIDKLGYCLEMLTCYDCKQWQDCPFAFDCYNTDNECLADK